MDVAVFLSCLAAFGVYYNSLDAGFVYDDSRAIVGNPDIRPTSPLWNLLTHDFWGTPLNHSGSHGSYRPLTVATFRVNYYFFGLSPYYYHLTNVVLHCVATGLVVRVARQIQLRNFYVLFCGVLFAVHPIHCEAVAGIVGRADIGSCIFFLSGFLCYVFHAKERDENLGKITADENRLGRKLSSGIDCNANHQTLPSDCTNVTETKLTSLIATIMLALASMLTKEYGITLLPFCVFYDILRYKMRPSQIADIFLKRKYRSLRSSWLTLAASFALLTAFRCGVICPYLPRFAAADNPTAKSDSFVTRTLTFIYLPVYNFWLLVFPYWLSFDWSMDSILPISSLTDWRNLITLLFYSILLHCLCKAYRLSVKPAKMDVSNERSLSLILSKSCQEKKQTSIYYVNTCSYSYETSSCPPFLFSKTSAVGLCIGMMILSFLPATNVFAYVGFVVAERVLYLPSAGYCLLVSLGLENLHKRIHNLPIWNKAYYRWCLDVFVFVLVGLSISRTVLRNRDWRDEEHLYRAGIAVNPPKAYGNLGSVLSSQGRLAEAEWCFRQALSHRPNMADVHYNLGNLLHSQARYEEALQAYNNAITFRSNLAVAYVEKSKVLIQLGRLNEAEGILGVCSRLSEESVRDVASHRAAKIDALVQLGRMYADQNKYHQAIDAYKSAAASISPLYPLQNLYIPLGEAYEKMQLYEEAEHWLRVSVEQYPTHVPSYLTYSLLLSRNESRIHEAEDWLLRAKKLAPSDVSVYLHLGRFLVSRKRLSEAAENFVEAAQLASDDVNVVTAAAHALYDVGRIPDAESYFRKALSLKPEDPSCNVNLGAVLHMQGKLQEAQQYYRAALRLDPTHAIASANMQRLQSLWSRKTKLNQSASDNAPLSFT